MKKYYGAVVMVLAALLMLAGCAGNEINPGSSGNRNIKENAGMDYEKAILKGVEYSWSSGSMARAAFSIKLNENEIVEASFYPMEFEPGDYDMKKLSNVKITAEQWKSVCDAVDILKPVLKEMKSNSGGSIFDKMKEAGIIQELDGGDTREFAITWEVDGDTVRKTYNIPEYERFCVLSTLLEEIAEPIGREIPEYIAAVLNGVHFVSGKERGRDYCSFQCTVKKEVPGKYRFYCYYPVDGKEVRYPTDEVGEDVWNIIKDKITELGIEGDEKGSTSKVPYVSLYYSNGKQLDLNPNAGNAEELKKTFFEIVGEEPKASRKSFFAKLFGK